MSHEFPEHPAETGRSIRSAQDSGFGDTESGTVFGRGSLKAMRESRLKYVSDKPQYQRGIPCGFLTASVSFSLREILPCRRTQSYAVIFHGQPTGKKPGITHQFQCSASAQRRAARGGQRECLLVPQAPCRTRAPSPVPVPIRFPQAADSPHAPHQTD